MKISEIRGVIRGSAYTRNAFSGIAEENRRQSIGPTLEAKIAELQALQIPERFADDRARREQEITYCRNAIARWTAAQIEPPKGLSARCTEGGSRHTWLGGMTCVLCGAPFTPSGIKQ